MGVARIKLLTSIPVRFNDLPVAAHTKKAKIIATGYECNEQG